MCIFINVTICSLFFDVNFGGKNIGYILALLLSLNMFACVTGVMSCCIFKSEEVANKILSTFVNIFAILGGIFFQLDGLGSTIRMISYVSPVKWIAQASFQIIYDSNLSLFIPTIAALLVVALLFLIVCRITFRTEDYV